MTTLVIVPGSFASSKLYDSFVKTLDSQGIRNVVVSLASVGRRQEAPATMSDDVEAITSAVTKLLDEGQEVVLLAHSYGGIPSSQSLERLSDKARRAEGKAGVKKIIYMAAVILPVGASNFDGLAAAPPDFVKIEDDYLSLDLSKAASLIFSGLSAEEAQVQAKFMDDQSTASFKEALRYPGYADVDEAHYITCEEDRIIPIEAQQVMVELLRGVRGGSATVHSLKADHVPNVSQPENVIEIIKKVIGGS